jgi:hypothetical protein
MTLEQQLPDPGQRLDIGSEIDPAPVFKPHEEVREQSARASTCEGGSHAGILVSGSEC